MSLYSLCVCLVPFFNTLSIFGINFGLIFSSFITLWFSKQLGPIYGCVCGFITGFACTNPMLSAPLGISGMTAGYLYSKSRKLPALSFFICTVFVHIYVFGSFDIFPIILQSGISCVIFTCFSHLLPDLLTHKKSDRKATTRPFHENNSEFDKVSDSLSGMSAILYKFSKHMKSPSKAETGGIFDSCLEITCKTCSMSEMCYAKRECNLLQVRNKVIGILHTRKIENDELSKLFLEKCIKIPELCDTLNARYSELYFITCKANRTQAVAGVYNSMSHLIKSTNQNQKEKLTRDIQLEKTIGDALSKIGIDYTYITVTDMRAKEIEVHGIRADKIPCSSNEISAYLSDKCKMLLTVPSFDISDNADMVMKMQRKESVNLEYAQCAKARETESVNGDTSSFFDTDNGFFYCLIADGMGSGKTAAATSRLSCIFLEKMLRSGASKTVCLEMLNNLLLSKNDETFSGIDMLEIDKLSGKAYFIKAGAAPSFVLRNGRLYRICSETPPVGIISTFSAESTRFAIEKEDVIIMLSDGVITAESDGLWLSELIHLDRENEPALLASELIKKAQTIGSRSDDATACVIKIS